MVEKNEIINNEEKIAETFNTFFTNTVSNLKILSYQDTDFARGINPFVGDDTITFTLVKWKITKKPSKYQSNQNFVIKANLSILKV